MDKLEIIDRFGIEKVAELSEIKKGHINNSFLVKCSDGEKFVLQSLNGDVFGNPVGVMKNIGKITEIFRSGENKDVHIPEYMNTADGENYTEAEGEIYRLYRYTEAAEISVSKGYAAGFSFGSFIKISGSKKFRPEKTIDGFHNYSAYFDALTAAASASSMKKIDGSVIRRLGAMSETLSQIFTVDFPKRRVHNDAKLDNVIFGKPCTVIDLDTVMDGYAAVDYGDMIRSSLSGGKIDYRVIRDITKGFSMGLDGILSSDEIYSLYYGILYVTGELAARYLIDYLSDEKYFKGKSSAECLGRANELLTQLNMFIACGDEITAIIYEEFRKK